MDNLKLLAAFLALLFCFSGKTYASEIFTYEDVVSFSDNLYDHVQIDKNSGVSIQFSEVGNKDVGIHLFVNNQSISDDMHDVIAKDLNSIAPAAGIKLKMGF